MSSPLKYPKATRSDAEISEAFARYLQGRPVKIMAWITGLTESGIKKMRSARFHRAWVLVARLIERDDDALQLLLDLANRQPPTALTIQQRNIIEHAIRIMEGGSQ